MDYAGHRADAPAPALSHRASAAQPHYPSYQPPPSCLPPYHPRPNPNPSPVPPPSCLPPYHRRPNPNPSPVPPPSYLPPYPTAVTAPYPYYGGPPAAAAAPYSDPGLGRSGMPSQNYSSTGGVYLTEPYPTTAAGGSGGRQTVAPYSDPGLGQAFRQPAYCNAVSGGGGGYGQTVPPYSDPGLCRAPRPPAYYNAVGDGGGGYGQTVPPYSGPGLGRAARPPAYYNAVDGGGGGYGHSFYAKEAVRQYGVDPQLHGPSEVIRQNGVDPHLRGISPWPSNGLVPTIQSSQTPLLQSNGAPNTPSGDITWRPQKRTNPGQSVHCEVCKIDCNNKEVLMSHKQGKKHKQNLLKLQEAITAKPAGARAGVLIDDKDEGSSVSNKEKAVRERKKKRAAMETATAEDLEMKKRRVLEGGGAASEMKVCTICRVVVNSQRVLDCHLSGLKHAAMVKKQQGELGE